MDARVYPQMARMVLDKLEADPLKINQPSLYLNHCKLLVILSILQFQAADNQLVFVHHQAFHNYFVFFTISESVSSTHDTTMIHLVYKGIIIATDDQFVRT